MELLKQEFIGLLTLKAQEFLDFFRKFDKDGNGYIEAEELDSLMISMLEKNKSDKTDPEAVEKAKQMLLKNADENYDGKIDMTELAALLLPKERFLVQFETETEVSSVDFMKIWYHYDSNWTGYIDGGEVRAFIFDMLSKDCEKVTPQRIDDYAISMLELFDLDKDGRFSFDEMSRIVPVVDNFLNNVAAKERLTDEEFNSIFSHYDVDGSGFIEGVELAALVKDIDELNRGMFDAKDIDGLVDTVLSIFDFNKDGKLQKGELQMIFCKN